MSTANTDSQFNARILRPKQPGNGTHWAFVVLPKEASAKLPRRGRTTVDGTINGKPFTIQLEPDGQKSHWLKIDEVLLRASGASYGDLVNFHIRAAAEEPDPEVPADLAEALVASPEAMATWDTTTNLSRVDWIHWITSAKQQKTRGKRINDACDMLAAGKKKVCCFDTSGFYSKAFKAPEAFD
ncbi:YdeI/OmpD-associated family protein [uncultured Microbulbifer sp.]|uniref:YdeI/OmpD-associated family protein n=1 Tax=uncultured Microbulbifer sp. TaxID=348147 RepID=UPI00260C4EA9|nr:YdeI/OmpD-associated family protein [uncultured Microbulbifer sp.]